MKEFYFPFEYANFLSATQLWTDEEVGVYIRLLIAQWQEGKLPEDLNTLSQVLSATPRRLRKLWPKIGAKFKPCANDNTHIYNPKMETVRDKVQTTRALLSEGGKVGAAKRWGHSNNREANGLPNRPPNGNQRERERSTLKKEKKPTKAKAKKPTPRHYTKTVSSLVSEIEAGCQIVETLPEKITPFNPYAWIQYHANKQGNPAAMLDTIKELVKYWPKVKTPWTYANKTMSRLNQNYNEAEYVADTIKFKEEWAKDPTVKALVGNLFKGV